MQVVVLGGGAIGRLFGARLASAGHAVLLVARPAVVDAVRRDGIQVEGVRPIHVTVECVATLPTDRSADVVLVTVKTFDLTEAGREVARAFRTPLPVLAPQNGLGVEDLLAAGLADGGWESPRRWIVRVIHSVPATAGTGGRVRQAGDGEILLPPSASDPRAPAAVLSALLRDLGYSMRSVPEFDREVWRKAILNAAINPVTADHGIPNGQLARDPWRGQSLALLEEARRAAAAEGYEFEPAALEQDLWTVVRATAENRSSMLQDLDRRRRTEIDQISGQILAAAARHGLALPATRRAYERILRRTAVGGPGSSSGAGRPQVS